MNFTRFYMAHDLSHERDFTKWQKARGTDRQTFRKILKYSWNASMFAKYAKNCIFATKNTSFCDIFRGNTKKKKIFLRATCSPNGWTRKKDRKET